MTYRRIFIYLLTGMTLMLAVAWWFSLKPNSICNIFIPGHHVSLRLHRGAMVITEHKGPYKGYQIQSLQVPAIAIHFEKEYPHGLFGSFHMSSGVAMTMEYRHVVFPLWLPYLILAGGTFAFFRRTERRLEREREEIHSRIARSGD